MDEAVRRFGDAWARGDTRTLEALLSPTYTHGDYYGGIQDRATWLAYAGRRTRLNTHVSFREVETRIVDNVAIVTGINDIQYAGDPGAVDRENRTIRFTQVWVWREGRWLREAFQATVSDIA